MTSDNSVCTLQITDTGGSHCFPAMVRLAIERGQAFILVYAIDNRKTFENLKSFYNNIISVRKTLEMTPLIIVGNKSDTHEREIPEGEGLILAKQWKCSFIETSAKIHFQTRELFEQLLQLEKRQIMRLNNAASKHKHSVYRSPKRTESVKEKCAIM